MKISDVMTREVATVQPDQTVQEAADFMLKGDAGSIPVTDGERLIGMITDRDIAVRGVAKGRGPDTPVRELMTDGVICARVDDNQKLCGIVSLGDLARESEGEAAHEALEGVSQPGGQHQQ